jgi:RNA recognition motif-containing protein
MIRIYVGNLSKSASESEIRDLFATHGTVLSLKLEIEPRTKTCRGYGFVEMEDKEARAAIDSLDGKPFGGQNIRVLSLAGC